jgi:radical SAM superfamily enzyme YgiQ (UPF0313 family)
MTQKKIKCMLVDPPFHAFFEYNRWWFSYACTQLAACLEEAGIETCVYDADKYFKKDPATENREEMVRRQDWLQKGLADDNHYVWKHFIKDLERIRPDIVGFSTWTSKHASTLKMIKICKSVLPEVTVCVGGYHATAVPEDFEQNELVDAIFIGHADMTLPKWILGGCREKVIRANPRDTDIRKLPFPSRKSLLHQENYSPTDMGMVMSSRGCPYDCTFCSNELLTQFKYTQYPIDQFSRELKHLVDTYKVDYIALSDANFLVNLKRSLEIAGAIKQFNIPWGCEGRIDSITDELVEGLMESGCTNISFGIEAGSDKELELLSKGITIKDILRAKEILNRHKMTWKCFFIIGFPHQTLVDMDNTNRFALSLDASFISLNSFVPLPGTKIWDSYKDVFAKNPNIYNFNQLSPSADFIPNVSSQEYKEKFSEVLKSFEDYNKRMKANRDFFGGS